MTIAGSDSISGAGIQQDLKVFSALGVYGTNVITAFTAQNTSKVYGVRFPDVDFLKEQIDAAMELKPHEVKIGLIGNGKICDVICEKMKEYLYSPILDPVLISTTNFKFYDDNLINSLKDLIKISKLTTPNLKEAEILSEIEINNIESKKKAALVIGNCVIKDEGEDLIYYNDRFEILKFDKIQIKTHGSGCVFSSAITSYLAMGYEMFEAIKKAKIFTYESIKFAINDQRQNLNLAILNPFFETERAVVKENIRLALKNLNECKKGNLKSICPEVGMNIAQITNFSDDIHNIAEFSGRIFYDEIGTKLEAIGDIEFDQPKKHLARSLFAYITYITCVKDNDIRKNKGNGTDNRAAINVRFSEENLEKFKNCGFEVSEFDRNDEIKENRIKEGKTMEFGIRTALIKNSKAEIIYDRGCIGKEPIIRVFGRDAMDAARKILKIL